MPSLLFLPSPQPPDCKRSDAAFHSLIIMQWGRCWDSLEWGDLHLQARAERDNRVIHGGRVIQDPACLIGNLRAIGFQLRQKAIYRGVVDLNGVEVLEVKWNRIAFTDDLHGRQAAHMTKTQLVEHVGVMEREVCHNQL